MHVHAAEANLGVAVEESDDALGSHIYTACWRIAAVVKVDAHIAT
jgi:hypothetical protein